VRNLDLEEIRKLLFEVLKYPDKQQYSPNQINHIIPDVEELAKQRDYSFSENDKFKTYELIWELIKNT